MRMAVEELRAALREDGVVLLRGFFAREPLLGMREAASRCFEAIAAGSTVPAHYRFSPHAYSVALTALLDFGCRDEEDLLTPLGGDGLDEMFSDLMEGRWRGGLEHWWVRKRFAPRHARQAGYHVQDWHQDGALGVRFPLEPGPVGPMNRLATCWIPLDACGQESPGLEFIRQRQASLLHFTELADAALRGRYGESAFWTPELELGDGLVFRNDVLHRTHVDGEMRGDRLSVDYRIFPA